MRRRVLLTPQVKQDIEASYLYIRADAPEVMDRVMEAIYEQRSRSLLLDSQIRLRVNPTQAFHRSDPAELGN